MERFLITGGAGFIGSNLAEHLVGRGVRVRVLDNLATGFEANLSGIVDRIELVRGSITDPGLVREALSGVDYAVHLAAIPSVQRSMLNPLDSHMANVTGTLTLLEEARRAASLKRLVLASSSSVYGETPELPKHEDLPLAPISVYGANKLACEIYAAVYRKQFGLPVVCLRYFNVFGPRQNPRSQYAAVIPNFIRAVLEGRPPEIYGDGMQTRDFTFVRNVIAANEAACRCPLPPRTAYNIACGEQTRLLDLFGMIRDLAGSDLAPTHSPARAGDIRDSLADVSLARKDLGFSPQWSLRQGLEETFRWYQSHLSLA